MRQLRNSFLFLLTTWFFSSGAQIDGRVCEPAPASEPVIFHETLLSESLEELASLYERTYESGARLSQRFYWDKNLNSYVGQRKGQVILVEPSFIQRMARQLELALERGYADYLIYSDMGHAHVLVKIGTPQAGLSFEEALKHKDTKLLYHTAELMRLRPGTMLNGPVSLDPWLAWRYHSRNFVGENVDGDSLAVLFAGREGYNTVRNLPGYREYAKIYFSATKNGCFRHQFKGRDQFFDISFTTFPTPPF